MESAPNINIDTNPAGSSSYQLGDDRCSNTPISSQPSTAAVNECKPSEKDNGNMGSIAESSKLPSEHSFVGHKTRYQDQPLCSQHDLLLKTNFISSDCQLTTLGGYKWRISGRKDASKKARYEHNRSSSSKIDYY